MKPHVWLLLVPLALACNNGTDDTKSDDSDTEIEDTDDTNTDTPPDTDDTQDTPPDTDDTPPDTDDTDPQVDPDDMDGDGYTVAQGDCNDDPNNGGAAINPGATEIASDGIDQDCNGFVATVDVSCHDIDNDGVAGPDTIASVRMGGPWWNGWDPSGGPVASDNGNGTWSVVFEDAPTENMEYKWLINETVGADPYENILDDAIAGTACSPLTDSANYANRQWVVGSGDFTDTLSRCSACP